jgi:hypothetical protein
MVKNLSKQALFAFVVAHRDAGTLTGKILKKVRARALALLNETATGDMVDLDLIWIASGCPKGREPHNWLASTAGKKAIDTLLSTGKRLDEIFTAGRTDDQLTEAQIHD